MMILAKLTETSINYLTEKKYKKKIKLHNSKNNQCLWTPLQNLHFSITNIY